MRSHDNARDLGEFVSDYWQMCRENGMKRPTAQEIAEAYADTAIETDSDETMFLAAVKELTPQVAYYLP